MDGLGHVAHRHLFDLIEEEDGPLVLVEGLEDTVEKAKLGAVRGVVTAFAFRQRLERVLMTAMRLPPVGSRAATRDGVEPRSSLLPVPLLEATMRHQEDSLGLVLEVHRRHSEMPEGVPDEAGVGGEERVDRHRRAHGDGGGFPQHDAVDAGSLHEEE